MASYSGKKRNRHSEIVSKHKCKAKLRKFRKQLDAAKSDSDRKRVVDKIFKIAPIYAFGLQTAGKSST